MAKKTDSETRDEESQDLIQSQAKQDNDKRVDVLEKQVTAIKSITIGLSGQIQDDRNFISKLDGGFDKTKIMVSKTLGKLDDMVTKGSTSIWTYVVIFVIIILALFYKLG